MDVGVSGMPFVSVAIRVQVHRLSLLFGLLLPRGGVLALTKLQFVTCFVEDELYNSCITLLTSLWLPNSNAFNNPLQYFHK